MARWQFWKVPGAQQRKSPPKPWTSLRLEALEDRCLMSLTVAPGYTVTTFAASPTGASQPDSIAVDGNLVFVGFGNGVAKDGSDGKASTIVEYTAAGAIVETFSVPGHNDGLKVDPETHRVWALQNEDGNPNLVVINPNAGTQTQYSFGPVANGGGFDDITFVKDKVFMTESNPSNNPNTDPAVVEATLNNTDHTVAVTTVLTGDAMAFNLVTKQKVQLNLQDPDSMTADRAGNLVLTSQADDEIVTIHHPGKRNQSVTVLPLQLSVDDTLFLRGGASGAVLLTDQATGTIYEVTGPALGSSQPLSAALDAGELGRLNVKTGAFTTIVSGLSSPRGLAFLGGPHAEEGTRMFSDMDAEGGMGKIHAEGAED
jgi:sugar lactone lactonase YvrE